VEHDLCLGKGARQVALRRHIPPERGDVLLDRHRVPDVLDLAADPGNSSATIRERSSIFPLMSPSFVAGQYVGRLRRGFACLVDRTFCS